MPRRGRVNERLDGPPAETPPAETQPAETPAPPSEGDGVLYNGGIGYDLKAVVTATYGGYVVAIDVTDDDGEVSPRRGVNYGDAPGTWHWPQSRG